MNGGAEPRYDQLFILKLNTFNSLCVLARRRFRRAKSIYCREASASARWFWKDRIRVIPDHTYTKIGDRYFVGVQFDIVTALTTQFFSEPDRYLRRFFALRMALEIYHGIGLVLDYQIMAASLSGNTCLLLKATPFLDAVRRDYARGALAIDTHWSVDGARRAFRTIAVVCVKVARAVAHSLRAKRRSDRDNSHPAISVFGHRGGESLDRRTDLFWLDSYRKYPNVVVQIALRRYARYSTAVIEELARKGIRVIETHGGRRLYANSIHRKPGLRFVSGVARSTGRLAADFVRCRSEPFGVRWWKSITALRYWLFVHQQLDYYRTFNIKAELRIGMGGVEEPAYSSALNTCGGFSCTAQYSMTVFYANYTSTSTVHLYFGAAYMNPHLPLCSRFSIANGYTFKTSLTVGDNVVDDLKVRLLNAGVSRSACFFEERPAYTFRVRYLVPAYQSLIQRVLDDPGFGLIIKPKKPYVGAELLREEIGPTFDQAMWTGRIIILGWDSYPGLVARAVDLTVGFLCTATLEAALLGRPTLHLNTRNFIPPFFRSASEHIFDNVPDLSKAVSNFFAEGHGSLIGRHSEDFIRGMDHYDDADASARIEYLVTRYVDEVAKGQAPEHALRRTIQGFRERWSWYELDSGVEQTGEALAPVGADL